jgi:hypothetical protein
MNKEISFRIRTIRLPAAGLHHCPSDPDETAELFLLNRLSPVEAARYREHAVTCCACALTLWESQNFIADIREACRDLPQREGNERAETKPQSSLPCGVAEHACGGCGYSPTRAESQVWR